MIKLLQDEEILYEGIAVNRSVLDEEPFETPLRRDPSNNGHGRGGCQPLVEAHILSFCGIGLFREGSSCEHGLVREYDSLALLLCHGQPLPDLVQQHVGLLWILRLLLLDIAQGLPLHFVPPIYFAEGPGRYPDFREAAMKEDNPLHEGLASPFL